MEKLMYINTVILYLLVIILVIRPYLQRFSIDINRTFWEKKPYGFTIMKWKYKKNVCPNSGHGIFGFNWRNPDNIEDDIKKAKR